jgi:hypothetical protein
MTFWQLVLHLFNFVLPALLMAVFMPLAGRWVMGPRHLRLSHRIVWHAVAGVVVLVVGLFEQGHDGTMATYAALVLVAAALEWVLQKGWTDT